MNELNYMMVYDDYLAHHGIKGQKWGIRRYQNPDGSLTAEGLKRYGASIARGEALAKAGNTRGKIIGKGLARQAGILVPMVAGKTIRDKLSPKVNSGSLESVKRQFFFDTGIEGVVNGHDVNTIRTRDAMFKAGRALVNTGAGLGTGSIFSSDTQQRIKLMKALKNSNLANITGLSPRIMAAIGGYNAIKIGVDAVANRNRFSSIQMSPGAMMMKTGAKMCKSALTGKVGNVSIQAVSQVLPVLTGVRSAINVASTARDYNDLRNYEIANGLDKKDKKKNKKK